ncbi:MAG: hypothetical protein JWM74_2512, partial [Myxococcaceae bacterium]|nr:hypothetical protein [Myxococcaceae bacterium]
MSPAPSDAPGYVGIGIYNGKR